MSRKKDECFFHNISNKTVTSIFARCISIQSIKECGKYCTDLELSTTPLTKWLPQWRHDSDWPTLLSVAVLVCPDQWCIFCTPQCINRLSCIGDITKTFWFLFFWTHYITTKLMNLCRTIEHSKIFCPVMKKSVAEVICLQVVRPAVR